MHCRKVNGIFVIIYSVFFWAYKWFHYFPWALIFILTDELFTFIVHVVYERIRYGAKSREV